MEIFRGLHAQHVSRALRIVVAAALALLAAFFLLYLSLTIVSYVGESVSRPQAEQLTDEQKLRILATLKASSTPSAEDRKATLKNLESSNSAGMTDAQKLDILLRLQRK